MKDALLLHDLLHSTRPNSSVTVSQELPLVLVAVIDTDGAIVQVGPQGLRRPILQTVMLHQPFAQFLMGGHARNDLAAVQAACLDMGGKPKHIVQLLLDFLVQGFGQIVASCRVHTVYRLRQLVQLLEYVIVQPDSLEMPIESGDGTVSVQHRRCGIHLALHMDLIDPLFQFVQRRRQLQLSDCPAAGQIQLQHDIPPIFWSGSGAGGKGAPRRRTRPNPVWRTPSVSIISLPSRSKSV